MRMLPKQFCLRIVLALLPFGLSWQVVSADSVNWSTDVEAGLRSSGQSGRIVLLKFTADWCGYCKKMERETFTRPAVARLVNENFVPVLVDADHHQELVRNLKVKGLPALILVSPDMAILSRISGYQTEEKLLPQLHRVLAQYTQTRQPLPENASMVQSRSTPARAVSQPSVPPSAPLPTRAIRTATTGAAAQPSHPQPSFGGLCLPAVRETRSLVSGTPQYVMRYRGRVLYFSNQEQLDKFRQSPAEYWPAQDGTCPVEALESRRQVEGKLEYAAMFRGQLWVTSSAANMKKFVASPAHYVDSLAAQ